YGLRRINERVSAALRKPSGLVIKKTRWLSQGGTDTQTARDFRAKSSLSHEAVL
ncbi:MAG: hypothetical protein QOH51_582, partial [Acidobacteriota bacterium]|nr:hypothetical protein [Acidobacteriota bacterium]